MSTDQYPESSAWTGWVIFAGFALIVVGCINAIQGLVAIFKHTVYVLPSSQLVVTTDYKAWGWTLLIWGIIMALAGLGLFSAKSWARWFAIFVVFINLIGQFAWFPAFPLWSMVAIALDIFILFALTVRWSEARSVLRS
jgi:hypothetical protein